MAENFQSNFVFGLQGNLYQDFLDSVAHPIIQDIIGTDDYEVIDFDKHLSLSDFDKNKRKDSIFPEFYLNFLGDIIKNNSVSFKKKVCITLDERLFDDTDICPNTGRKITAIKLAGVELAYFIYFDIKEFFDFVYDNEIQKHQSQKDINIRFANDKESLDNKIENPEKVDEQNSNSPILDESIIPKLFSGKSNNNNASIADYIEKIGYIHSKEIGYSRIKENIDGKNHFIIPHSKEFPKFKDLPIGTAIKALGKLDSNGRFFVEKYEEVEIDELPFQLITVNGTLFFYENSNFTLIKTNLGNVYAEFGLFKNYKPNIEHQVKCIIVESYDNKKGEMGWKAIWVGNSL